MRLEVEVSAMSTIPSRHPVLAEWIGPALITVGLALLFGLFGGSVLWVAAAAIALTMVPGFTDSELSHSEILWRAGAVSALVMAAFLIRLT